MQQKCQCWVTVLTLKAVSWRAQSLLFQAWPLLSGCVSCARQVSQAIPSLQQFTLGGHTGKEQSSPNQPVLTVTFPEALDILLWGLNSNKINPELNRIEDFNFWSSLLVQCSPHVLLCWFLFRHRALSTVSVFTVKNLILNVNYI